MGHGFKRKPRFSSPGEDRSGGQREKRESIKKGQFFEGKPEKDQHQKEKRGERNMSTKKLERSYKSGQRGKRKERRGKRNQRGGGKKKDREKIFKKAWTARKKKRGKGDQGKEKKKHGWGKRPRPDCGKRWRRYRPEGGGRPVWGSKGGKRQGDAVKVFPKCAPR